MKTFLHINFVAMEITNGYLLRYNQGSGDELHLFFETKQEIKEFLLNDLCVLD